MLTWSFEGAGCCSCCTLILLVVSIILSIVTNIGFMRGEGPFCDPRCNDEAEERYREAVQEACVRSDRDENGMWQDPCDWSTVPDKPAKVEPVEGHYHCYFEGDDEDFTYECMGLEYPMLGVTAAVLFLYVFSCFMLVRAARARDRAMHVPRAPARMHAMHAQEAVNTAEGAPAAEQPNTTTDSEVKNETEIEQ